MLLRVEREQSESGAAQFTKDNVMAVLMVSCQSFAPIVIDSFFFYLVEREEKKERNYFTIFLQIADIANSYCLPSALINVIFLLTNNLSYQQFKKKKCGFSIFHIIYMVSKF